MKIQYSLWLIMFLLWGASAQIIVPRNHSSVKDRSTEPAEKSPPPATVASADIPVVATANTGRITSLTFRQYYSAGDVAQAVKNFFGTYAYRGARLPVQTFDITFTSLDFDRSPVAIHAQVFVPLLQKTGERPVYVFASGTTGIGDLCAPSLEQPDIRRWGWYRENMLAYASLGYIVIFPDYTGFHDASRPQRYFSKYAEGYMMLDAIRAIFNFFNQPAVTGLAAKASRAVFTSGYSQGGHAAFAAADLQAVYAPEVPLIGVITYGGTNNVEALLREGVAYGPLILYSYMMMYGREHIIPADYLLPQWLPTFEADSSTMSVDLFQRHFGFDGKKLYAEKFLTALTQGSMAVDFPELTRLLEENHTGHSGHRLPALIIQGSEDFIVTNRTQSEFAARLQELGSEVQFDILPYVSHRDTRAAGFETSVTWMEERLQELNLQLIE